MTYDDFIQACDSGNLPTTAADVLRSLFEDRRGDWDTAHTIAQSIHTRDGSLVHAYLHREEGDLANAGYWYSRAEASMPETPIEKEWDDLARRLTS